MKRVDGKSPKAIVLEFVGRINARDLDGIVGLMTEDHVFTDSGGRVQTGREGMRAGWQGYLSAYPEYRIHFTHVLGSGADVALFGTVSGSHLGPEQEQGRTFIWTASVHRGQVASWRVYAGDSAGNK